MQSSLRHIERHKHKHKEHSRNISQEQNKRRNKEKFLFKFLFKLVTLYECANEISLNTLIVAACRRVYQTLSLNLIIPGITPLAICSPTFLMHAKTNLKLRLVLQELRYARCIVVSV